jgi:hypothetical protein
MIRGLAFMHSLGVVHGDIKAVGFCFVSQRCSSLSLTVAARSMSWLIFIAMLDWPTLA